MNCCRSHEESNPVAMLPGPVGRRQNERQKKAGSVNSSKQEEVEGREEKVNSLKAE